MAADLKEGFGIELVKRLVLPMVEERSREPGDAWHQAADAILSLIRERDEARFRPLGDNHHNAWACPHCNPEGLKPEDYRRDLMHMRARAEAVEAALAVAQDRIFDLLLPEDGYAAKEARKYLAEKRPDLIEKLNANPAAAGRH